MSNIDRPDQAAERLLDAFAQDIIAAGDDEMDAVLVSRGGASALRRTRRTIEAALERVPDARRDESAGLGAAGGLPAETRPASHQDIERGSP